jgi:hypothetical protein
MNRSAILCPYCNSKLEALPELRPGDEVRCPSCERVFPVPASDPSVTRQAPPPGPETGGIATAPGPGARPRPEGVTPDADPDLERWGGRQGGAPEYDEDHPPRSYRDYDYGEGRTGPLSTDYAVDMGRWFALANAHYSQFLLSVVFTLIAVVINQVIAQIPYVGGIINLFVSPPMFAGLTLVALKQLKGERWAFGDFFGGFQSQWYLSLVGYNFLSGLVIALPLLPGAVVLGIGLAANDETLVLGGAAAMLVLGVISIYLGVRLGLFGTALILDRRYRAIDAMRGSWELTQDHFWSLFAVQLVLGLILLGGVLLLCVGYLFALPFVTLVNTAGYLLIAGTRSPLERPYESSGGYGGGQRYDADDRYGEYR